MAGEGQGMSSRQEEQALPWSTTPYKALISLKWGNRNLVCFLFATFAHLFVPRSQRLGTFWLFAGGKGLPLVSLWWVLPPSVARAWSHQQTGWLVKALSNKTLFSIYHFLVFHKPFPTKSVVIVLHWIKNKQMKNTPGKYKQQGQ